MEDKLKESKAVFAALAANVGIAICKFIAFLLTSSSSLLAESVHSVVDSGNEVLLLVGKSRGERKADKTHSFGYSRDRYFYSFVVGFMLFTAGGLFALYEAFEKFEHPEAITAWQWVPVVVLIASIVMESFSFRTAIHEARESGEVIKTPVDIIRFVKNTKSAELPVVLLEDFAALVGLCFALVGISGTLITGDGRWDAIGSGAIGVLLVIVASLLIVEMKSLLLGESLSDEDEHKVRETILKNKSVFRILDIKSSYLGPETILLALKVDIEPNIRTSDVVDELEAAIRSEFTGRKLYIFVEEDDFDEDYDAKKVAS